MQLAVHRFYTETNVTARDAVTCRAPAPSSSRNVTRFAQDSAEPSLASQPDPAMHLTLRRSSSRSRLLALGFLALVATGCASSGASFVPPSQPAQFSLAGVPWGIPADSVTALIEPKGYNFNRADRDGDLWYDGILFRAPSRVYAFMAEGKLVKFRVFIGSEDADAITVYRSARAELVKQYGAPKETVEEYAAPYKKGDSRELEAIKKGKGTLHTYWTMGEGARATYISVQVTNELAVAVDYDGPAWRRESLRRRKAD